MLFVLCVRVVQLLSSLKGIESVVCHHDLASIHRCRTVILVQGMLCSQGRYMCMDAFRSWYVLSKDYDYCEYRME